MKQKYTLSIADMEINVITDEPHETVEYIVGILDRKMREIALKSKRCTKNEAALLCALDLCADKIRAKEQAENLEDQLDDANDKIKRLEEKMDYVQKSLDRLEKERARLEVENGKLRAILDDARAGKTVTAATVAAATVQDTDDSDDSAPIAEKPVGDVYATEAPAEEKPAPAQKKKTNKSRVGSMFDLLTFTDI
jgi:cell division protein ZapA (FtsZ GTPase activity inhibitor)